jgi:hypothetical protein
MSGARERIEAENPAVFRAFVRDGRIVSFPAKWSKRLVLLDWAAQSFEPGRAYTEVEVNDVLASLVAERWDADPAARADHVTLRRYLVDADLLGRDSSHYWRTGGAVDLD